ncbi:MAG TPA: Hsp20/alpha crystallin family protein [Pirellulales bacterium]|jgi:HSP20 family protein|nr:Hsp20/alpha crystallin family protein [Pirellulales bacterium]
MMMSRLRGNGFAPLGQLRGEVDRLFEDFFGQGGNVGQVRGFPPVNVWEGEHELFAEAELPGLKNEDLEISVVGNELSIKGRRVDSAQEGTTYHRRERGAGEFVRVLRLPVEIDAERVQANLRDGVLTLTLPKAEKAKPRKINVATN